MTLNITNLPYHKILWAQLCKGSQFCQEGYKEVPEILPVLQMYTLSMNIIKSGGVLQVNIKSVCSAVVTTD